MKGNQIAAVAAGIIAPAVAVNGSPTGGQRRAAADDISSCGDEWMPRVDVSIADGTDERKGFETAVDEFCTEAGGESVPAGGYLSYATEVFMSGGGRPSEHGTLGFVYFEVHNKGDGEHAVDKDGCVENLKTLSAVGGKCTGSEEDGHDDTKGGTYEAEGSNVSYHALANQVPPAQDGLNKLYTEDALEAQEVSTGGSAALDPWPLDSLSAVGPVSCHSHNDYDQPIPLYSALAAGCISVEADVWYDGDGGVEIGHDAAKAGRTLRAQYVDPLLAIIEHNGGSVFASKPDQTLTLMVDFKTDDAETLDAVVGAVAPLREGGYLSSAANGTFKAGAVSVVCSGSADFDRIASRDGVPDADVFYDAKLDDWDERFSQMNSGLASAKYDGSADVQAQLDRANDAGLTTRYWEMPGEDQWQELMDMGLDLIGVDDLMTTAQLARI